MSIAIEICRYMGWSWKDYCEAPGPMLDAIMIRMNEEAIAASAKKDHGTGS
jgi:hypothetical protein